MFNSFMTEIANQSIDLLWIKIGTSIMKELEKVWMEGILDIFFQMDATVHMYSIG